MSEVTDTDAVTDVDRLSEKLRVGSAWTYKEAGDALTKYSAPAARFRTWTASSPRCLGPQM